MATRRAAPIPRVARDRRDDRYDAGLPAPPKRAESGYVVSIQDDTDTVTVDILDEQLTGVVPLGDMPPVGAVVEVESRGDLLVIPMWYEGPPVPETLTVDLPAHNITTRLRGPSEKALIVGGPEALATRSTDSYVRMDSTTTHWAFNVGYDDTTGAFVGGFGLWTPPDGATVTDTRFVAEGYRDTVGAGDFPQDDYDNAPALTSPVIYTYPFVVFEMSGLLNHPTVSTFPIDTVGEALGQPTGFSPIDVDMAPLVYLATYPFPIIPMALTITYLAIRITYTAA